MKVIAFLIGLPAVAFALDIRGFSSSDCSGDNWVCTNWNPNDCCVSPGGGVLVNSLGFYGILPEWNIQVKGYNNGGCGFQKTTDTAHDTNFKCLTDGPYTGAGYAFVSASKRSVQGGSACTNSRLPDYYETKDGKIYSFTVLSDAEASELRKKAPNATVSEFSK